DRFRRALIVVPVDGIAQSLHFAQHELQPYPLLSRSFFVGNLGRVEPLVAFKMRRPADPRPRVHRSAYELWRDLDVDLAGALDERRHEKVDGRDAQGSGECERLVERNAAPAAPV